MMHYWVGNLGHFFVITSFVTAIAAAFSYFRAVGTKDLHNKNAWVVNGRTGYYLHALATIGICVMLFVIISQHYFEYHYAYSHSDRKLSTDYLISTFWNGQEGSFLLWMFWQALLGIVLIHTNKFWEAPVMTVFALVQAFLASMILGVVLPGIAVKIGSSPFILLREVMHDAPIFKTNPNFIPEDGTGLNPLLQNYWMVIHPPTLFLGFATTLVPFSFCIAGLWFKKYREWIRPALPWALFSAAILGLGILMGGYWAYETLNFGGYWNWDPVENGVYVPWLVLVGAIHTMISYKNSETALKASVILAITTFILILYSTFLTRSGVLGDTSVHSFTDLGLSGQLLTYLLFFAVAAIVLAIVRWREIPSSKEEAAVYSREFWIFIGVITLCFMAFQVLIPTSYPVWNQFVGLFGIKSSLAPPGDQITFYSKFQVWFAIIIATLSGAVQFLWWKKIDLKTWMQQLFIPFVVALLATLVIVNVRKVFDIRYVLMLLTGLFTICANIKIAIQLLRTSAGLSGGAVAHIGVGLMLIGVMFSAGYSKIVSLNNTGLQISKDFSDEFNRDNLILFVNEPRTMWGYDIEYMGERLSPRYHAGYVRRSDIVETLDKDLVIAKTAQYLGGVAYQAGDTIGIKGEDTYYEIQLRKNGKTYTLYPRAQINPEMGGMLASPDIYRTVSADLYTHVSSVMNPDEETEWSPLQQDTVSQGQQFFANDYVTVLESVERVNTVEGVTLRDQDVAVKAHIKVQGEHGEYVAEPIFLIRDKLVAYIPDEINDLGLRFTLVNIRPETNTFIMGVNTRQKDWVIIKAMEKPFINILWIGTLVLMFGFGIAMVRRFREFIKMKAKGQE